MSYNDMLRCDNLTTNHEGAAAWRMTPEWELYTTVVTTMGTEDKFYEGGNERIRRITELVRKVDPVFVAQLAIYTRERMHLRSVPLLLLVELSMLHKGDSLVSRAVGRTIQRADEMAELLACWQWRSNERNLGKVGHQLLRGLAMAFGKFDEYQLAKYGRRMNQTVTMRDALALAHPKPKDRAQAALFRKVLDGTLETPYTWETRLSAAGQRDYAGAGERKAAKRRVWEDLIDSGRLGYMAALRNLRNLLRLGLDCGRMEKVCRLLADRTAVLRSKQLPFRFLSAYLELAEDRDVTQMEIEGTLARVCLGKEKIRQSLAEMDKGFYLSRMRKVRKCLPGKWMLYNVATVRGKLEYKNRKWHRRVRVWRRKQLGHPSPECLNRRRKLERRLACLQQREDRLRRKLWKHMRKTDCDSNLHMVMRALEDAARHTAENIPGFSPQTRILLASDTSGSMLWPVSERSKVMNYHIGLLISMLMKNRCQQAVTGMFADVWKVYDMPTDDILSNTQEMMRHEGEVGYSTCGHEVIDWLIREKHVMDKVMIFTDIQLWDSWYDGEHLQKSWDEYKKLAPEAKLYLFDLAGYGQSPVSLERDDVYCIAGWSDKVFDILAALESGSNAIDEIRRIVV